MVEVKWWSMFNFEAVTSKFCNCSWKFGFLSWKGKVDPCMTNSSKVLIYLILLYFLLHNLQISVYEIQQSQINQNFGTVCRTEVYLTFSRLGAKLSGTNAKFRFSNIFGETYFSNHKYLIWLNQPCIEQPHPSFKAKQWGGRFWSREEKSKV